MKEGDVFRFCDGHELYRVKARVDRRCEGCAGRGRMALCRKLPFCRLESGYVIFMKLSAREAEGAIKNGTEIVTY